MKPIIKIESILEMPTKAPRQNDEQARHSFLEKYGRNFKAIKELKKAIAAKEKELNDFIIENGILETGEKYVSSRRDEPEFTISLSQPKFEQRFDLMKFRDENPELYEKYNKEIIVKSMQFDTDKFYEDHKDLYMSYVEDFERKPVISFNKVKQLELE